MVPLICKLSAQLYLEVKWLLIARCAVVWVSSHKHLSKKQLEKVFLPSNLCSTLPFTLHSFLSSCSLPPHAIFSIRMQILYFHLADEWKEFFCFGSDQQNCSMYKTAELIKKVYRFFQLAWMHLGRGRGRHVYVCVSNLPFSIWTL